MGYYTRYRLQVRGLNFAKNRGEICTETIVRKLIANNAEASDALGSPWDPESGNEFTTPVKWYDWELDLKEWSTKVPDAVFVLHATGEDGSQWRAFAKNGNVVKQNGKLVFPMEPEL